MPSIPRSAWLHVFATLALLTFTTGCQVFGPSGTGNFDTVILDAGHGAHDRGARPLSGSYEKTVALDTTLRLKRALEWRGFKVILTRSNDTFIPLGNRVKISNSRRNAIFVSIHYNWAAYPSAQGIETYYYNSNSSRLAANIQSELLRAYKTKNRGVKRRGFYVLRKNSRPAVLVECGFLSNPVDNSAAQNARTRQRIADSIAKGIANERRGKKP